MFVVSIESGEKRQLTIPKRPVLGDTDPAVSPDGRWLVFRRDVGTVFADGFTLVHTRTQDLKPTGEPRAAHADTADRIRVPEWMLEYARSSSGRRASLWRMNIRDGNAPSGSHSWVRTASCRRSRRPQPGRPGRLAYVRSFCGHKHLADRDLGCGCGGLLAPCGGDRVDATGRPGAVFTRRSQGRVHLGSIGRTGSLGSGFFGGQCRSAHILGRDSRLSALVSRWPDHRVPLQTRSNIPTGLSTWCPRKAARFGKSRLNPTTDVFAELLARRHAGSTSARRAPSAPSNLEGSRYRAARQFRSLQTAGVLALESQRRRVSLLCREQKVRGAGAVVASAAQGRRTGKTHRGRDGHRASRCSKAGSTTWSGCLTDTKLRYFDFARRRSTVVAEKLGVFGFTASA